MLDLFGSLFQGLFSSPVAQATAQAETPPPVPPQSLANLFQFDADGGREWLDKAFNTDPPEWAPWHPDFEFRDVGAEGSSVREEGVYSSPNKVGARAYIESARAVNEPNVEQSLTRDTGPVIEKVTPVIDHRGQELPPLPERPSVDTPLPERGSRPGLPEPKPGREVKPFEPPPPPDRNVRKPLSLLDIPRTPPPPELNTSRELSTLDVSNKASGKDFSKILTSGKIRGRVRGWTRYNKTFNQLNPYEKAAAIALMEADGKRYEDAKNAAGAMVNRAVKLKEDIGRHVSRSIYQPTIEPAQERRLGSILRSSAHKNLTQWIENRAKGLVPDPVKGATHFLAHPKVMLRLSNGVRWSASKGGFVGNSRKYYSWPLWTGYDPRTGTYKGQVFTDRSHAFLIP